LESRLSRIEKEMSAVRDHNTHLNSDNRQLYNLYTTCRDENIFLQDDVGEMRKSYHLVTNDLKVAKESNHSLQHDLVQLQNENAVVRADNVMLRGRIDRLEKVSVEVLDHMDDFDKTMEERIKKWASEKVETDDRNNALTQRVMTLKSQQEADKNIDELTEEASSDRESASRLLESFAALFKFCQRLVSPTSACHCELRIQ